MELIVRNKNNEHGELLDYFGVPQPMSNKVEQTQCMRRYIAECEAHWKKA